MLELWYEQGCHGRRALGKGGLYDLNSEVDAIDTAGLFINSSARHRPQRTALKLDDGALIVGEVNFMVPGDIQLGADVCGYTSDPLDPNPISA